MADDWCPENDGAYRAEMAALHRDNVDQQLFRARAEIERLRAALGDVIDCNHHSFCDGGLPKYVRIARDALAQKGGE